MNEIQNYIEKKNELGRKVLSIFLTSGFPRKDNFTNLAKEILNSGADMLELGIPFSDPLADGSTIQNSSKIAIDNGTTINDVFKFCESITTSTNKPIVLMGYANPILKYGIKNFFESAQNSGAKGLIVPDVPVEEYDSFYENVNHNLDIILLTTPTSTEKRIQGIDLKSKGFVYCVSVTGTTGIKSNISETTIENIKRTRSLIVKNKMMIGFGISKPEDILTFSPYCDGVIVGSAIIKSLLENGEKNMFDLIKRLSEACGS